MAFAEELPVIALWVPSLVFLGIYMSFIGITYLVGWSFASAGGQGSSANKLQRFFVSTVDEIVQHLVSEGGDGEANGAVVADIRETLESHYTSVRAIFWIGFPTAICAVISPLILQSRKMSSQFIFLTDDLPGINEAVACFLVPAGMVYAIFFGFTYQHVHDRMRRATQLLCEEAEVIERVMETMDQIVAADTRKGRSIISVDKRRQLYLACRDQAIQIFEEIININAIPDETEYLPGLWQLYPWCYDMEVELSAVNEKMPHWSLKLIQEMISNSRRPVVERRVLCKQRVSLAEWIFLLLLGMFSFYGMMLVDAGSELMQLTLCAITAISVGYLLLFLSDMDELTRGTFTVDVRVITKTIGLAMSSLDHLVERLSIDEVRAELERAQIDARGGSDEDTLRNALKASFTAREMNERQVFDAIDDDGDGKLDRAEFNMAAAFLGAALRRLNTAEELDEIFTVIDLDQTGEVSFEEFTAW